MSGGKKNTRGVPPGGVISPLLANLYINRFLKYWRITERGKAFWAHVVSYADDFVILSYGGAQQSREWTRRVMKQMGLTLKEEKTGIRDAQKEYFDFLGYTFGAMWFTRNGTRYRGAMPSRVRIDRLKIKVREQLKPSEKGKWPEVCKQLNNPVKGMVGILQLRNNAASISGN